MKKVILLGKGDFAIKIAKWLLSNPNYQLVGIVPVIPEPDWTSSIIQFSKLRNIPCAENGTISNLATLIGPSKDVLGISIFYEKILKQSDLDLFYKIINFHPSPLPRYRGVRPINWALKNGETEHGVTFIEMTPGIDNGPIISQLKYTIYPEVEEVIDVFDRALEYGFQLFIDTMRLLDKISPRIQNESLATYFSRNQNDQLGEYSTFTKALSRDN